MSKKTETEKTTEIDKLKSKLFDMDSRIDEVVNRVNQLSVVMDFHAHETRQTTGRPYFLQEQYQAFVESQQQRQQTPPSKEETETKEE